MSPLIKRIFISIISYIGNVWSYAYSHDNNGKINFVKDLLYTAWISREFKCCGEGTIICPCRSIVGGKYISIGERCKIGLNTVLTAWSRHGCNKFSPQIVIGNDVAIGDDSHITAINRIDIGDNVLTGKKITITDNNHGNSKQEISTIPPARRILYSEGPVIIESNVWIGEKVTILANVRIGKNAIIGANAVVTCDIPSNSVACGIPAKVIKRYANI